MTAVVPLKTLFFVMFLRFSFRCPGGEPIMIMRFFTAPRLCAAIYFFMVCFQQLVSLPLGGKNCLQRTTQPVVLLYVVGVLLERISSASLLFFLFQSFLCFFRFFFALFCTIPFLRAGHRATVSAGSHGAGLGFCIGGVSWTGAEIYFRAAQENIVGGVFL